MSYKMGMRNTLKTYDVLLAISKLLNNAIHREMQGTRDCETITCFALGAVITLSPSFLSKYGEGVGGSAPRAKHRNAPGLSI